MTEPVEALRTLADVPPSPPEAVDALYQRAAVRRRRRTRWRAGLGVVAAVVVAVAVVPLLDRPSDDRTSVVAGPGPSSTSLAPAAPTTSTTVPLEFVPGQPISTRIDYQVPPGWQTLFAQGDHVVLATRPLSDADRTLALLARDDSAFTSSFPPDAVVVVAGNDPTEAKYLLRADGSAVGPGPSYDRDPRRRCPAGCGSGGATCRSPA